MPIETLLEESSELAGELERGGLLSTDVVRRIACDATIAVAVDDDVGHTMYEGRATRDPTDAQRREVMRRDRHCRFPGCANVTFTNVHHLEPWIPAAEPTSTTSSCCACIIITGSTAANGRSPATPTAS